MRNVTFSGIDAKTNVQDLINLVHDYPDFNIEFAVLLSKHWYENGNRYGLCKDLSVVKKLHDAGIKLSGHLCGSFAKEAYAGNWANVREFLGDYVGCFDRFQINVAPYDGYETLDNFSVGDAPETASELIFQFAAHSLVDNIGYGKWFDGKVSVLFDGSGGEGKIMKDVLWAAGFRCGYAGGINPNNVVDIVKKIESSGDWTNNYWIDMESGVRTDDWFDVKKAEAVLKNLKEIS